MKIKNIKVFSTALLLISLSLNPANADILIIGEPTKIPDTPYIELEGYPSFFKVKEGARFQDELWEVVENYPINIKNLFEKYHIKLILVEQDGFLEEKYDHYGVKGIFDRRQRIVYVEALVKKGIIKDCLEAGVNPEYLEGYDEESLSLKVYCGTMIHEISHAIDYIYSDFSQSDKFKTIFDKEWQNIMKTTHFNFENKLVVDNINKPNEYFATAMVVYVLYPEELQEYCPETYQFISEVILTINESLDTKTK